MGRLSKKVAQRRKRHLRVRRRIEGTPDRPRLSVHKSLKHIRAQIINDWEGHTLVAASTMEATIADGLENTYNSDAARAVGLEIGKRALEKGIKQVVLDRGGWPMHGKLAAFADGAREAGLEF